MRIKEAIEHHQNLTSAIRDLEWTIKYLRDTKGFEFEVRMLSTIYNKVKHEADHIENKLNTIELSE